MANHRPHSVIRYNYHLFRAQATWCICAVLILFLSVSPSPALADSPLDKLVKLDIPANSRLEDALIEWGIATGVTVMINTSTVADQDTDGVHGTVLARDALASLLRRSGLTYKEEGSRISVVPRGHLLHSALQGEDAEVEGVGGTASDLSTPAESSVPVDLDKKRRPPSLEEVLVTATRREERLLDTPIAVTALDTDTLSQTGVKSIVDFADSVPGMIVMTQGAGTSQISFRGVTTGQADVSPTTAIYFDDVPFGNVGGPIDTPDSDLFDLDRIEVLRGPQGTQYGVSSMGGLLKYVTKLPDLTSFDGKVQLGAGAIHEGGVDYTLGGAANIPVVPGVLGVRASAYGQHDGGYFDNVELGRPNVNRANTYGARLDALLKVNDALSVRMGALFQNIDRKGWGSADYLLTGQPAAGALDQFRAVPEPFHSQFHIFTATVNYDFGPAKLTSISAYQDFEWRLVQDSSYNLPYAQSFGYPFTTYTALQGIPDQKFEKFSQEMRLASNGAGPFQWVVGAFYSHQANSSTVGIGALTATGARISPANTGIFNLTGALGRFDEIAGFGNLTVRVTDKLDITGGVRYAQDTVAGDSGQSSGLFAGGAPTYVYGLSHAVTYLGNATYHFDPNQMAYLRYATGYRPGGTNHLFTDPATGLPSGSPSFSSDSLKSYEVGYKTSLFEGRLVVDVAGYHINWSDIQITAFTAFSAFTENAPGGASIWGSELSVSGRPMQSLLLSGTFAYQDAYLRQASPFLGAYAGERLPNVPRATGTLGADYDFNSLRWRPSVGASARYMDARWSSFDGAAAIGSYPQYHLPDYAVVDLRAGLQFGGGLGAQFYVRNALNKLGQLSGVQGSFVGEEVAIIQPRTIGLNLTKRF
jgi:outer membrane receptor protein involved in Fe transport